MSAAVAEAQAAALAAGSQAALATEPVEDFEQHTEELERTWRRPRGLWGWLSTVDHKEIGKRFIVTALVFFALGGVLALLMRIQLARPENHFVSPDLYDQLFLPRAPEELGSGAVRPAKGRGAPREHAV